MEEYDLNKILSCLFQLCELSTKQSEKIKKGEIENKIHTKSHDEKYTDLDYLIQKLIENTIKKYFPKIKIIGEEDTSLNIEINEKNTFLNEISKIDINKNYFNLNDYNYKISTNDKITLFIDPIDATNQLIINNYEPVTILIGICINEKPISGIIHYLNEIEKKHFSETYFNYPNKGILKYYKNKIEKIQIKKNPNFKFLISSTRAKEEMINFIKTFEKSDFEQMHGCGNKIINTLLNDYCYFTFNSSVALWDICAGDCLAHSIGGGIFNFKGEEIKYVDNYRDYIKDYLFVVGNSERKKLFIENVKKVNYHQNE